MSKGTRFIIRKVTPSDAEEVRSLRLQLVKENPKVYGVVYSTERRKHISYYTRLIREHQKKDASIFIVTYGSRVIGMGLVRRNNQENPTEGYLGSLGIIKEFQGLGLGKRLIEFRLEWIKKHTQFKVIKTIVTKKNIKMLNLAENFGFKIVGQGSYYGVPEFYMEKNL